MQHDACSTPGCLACVARSTDGSVAAELLVERRRQDEKWGEQNHPDGTGGVVQTLTANAARRRCQEAAIEGSVTWEHILSEEIFEAYAEDDPAALRAELIQCGAVIIAWIRAIDRRP